MDCRTQLASLAIEELDKGDFLMATKILTTGIKLEPNNHELYFERSICHHKLGNYQASLDDADSAIRLNASDYNIHYQKGLALVGLAMFSEAVVSFKKAIELRAKQEDSKLSDIFKLLRDVTNELNSARRRPGTAQQQLQLTTTTTTTNTNSNNNSTTSLAGASAAATHNDLSPINNNNNNSSNNSNSNPRNSINASTGSSSNDPVDSTTDRAASSSNHHPNIASLDGSIMMQNNSNNNLVAANHNDQPANVINSHHVITNNDIGNHNNHHHHHHQHHVLLHQHHQSSTAATGASNRVSSSASHFRQDTSNNNVSPDISSVNINDANDFYHHHLPVNSEQPKAGSFEWNIRRSERIFLHQTNEPGTSGAQFNVVPGVKPGGNSFSIVNNNNSGNRHKTTSNSTSSISNSKSAKHLNEIQHESQPNKTTNRSKTLTTNSHNADSDIDVDDSCQQLNHQLQQQQQQSSVEAPTGRKRVMVAPSSSMPATSLAISGSSSTGCASKDDSYSSKYKRLRRDRERARRGTSKLCTIKASDLDELHRASGDPNSSKKSMRVIAPIDGWLYSGRLQVDSNICDDNSAPQYVVKLDGDTTGSSYLFTQDTVLNDVIKEVRVKSVSELRKGARICCYWSRTYKCLSTGVVTSRTFEATKSLVSVKYDNGDLSALPLEDLRLLPPDYPKYMSNCDPLLLARNSDGVQSSYSDSNGNKIIVEPKNTHSVTNADINAPQQHQHQQPHPPPPSQPPQTSETVIIKTESNLIDEKEVDEVVLETVEKIHRDHDQDMESLTTQENILDQVESKNQLAHEDDDDEALPATNEAIDFITNEVDADDHHRRRVSVNESDQIQENRETMTKDASVLSNGSQLMAFDSRASSEENNYGIEYRPWVFEGAPKRNKRHGRTYRDNYMSIRRGSEVIKIGDSAELMPRDESILPFIAKIDGLWATSRGEMRVRVRWYYRLYETEGEPYELRDGENALFETDHFDENDVQSIYRSTKILSWREYSKDHLGYDNTHDRPKRFYLAGYYDPVRRIKHLRSDVKEAVGA